MFNDVSLACAGLGFLHGAAATLTNLLAIMVMPLYIVI